MLPRTGAATKDVMNSGLRIVGKLRAPLLALSPILLAIPFLVFCGPASGQETFSRSPDLDAVIDQAVRSQLIPGAVLIVGHEGKIVHRKAYGNRALIPAREPMTVDTIFDIASLTKVVATTPALMILLEQGKLRLSGFRYGLSSRISGRPLPGVTIQQLLTHSSGLRPDLDLDPVWSGYETGIRKALSEKSDAPPGTSFVYSDINFELLGEIVRKASGESLDEFARNHVFEPLGMRETMFRPPASLLSRIAPTQIDPSTGAPLRGTVDDPTARYMGGVAGHAGVFSTAGDLARYAEMWLGRSAAAHESPRASPSISLLRPIRRPVKRWCAGSDGISIPLIRRRAAICSGEARMATLASRARRFGSIQRPKPTSSS